jgi:hypothetical protein
MFPTRTQFFSLLAAAALGGCEPARTPDTHGRGEPRTEAPPSTGTSRLDPLAISNPRRTPKPDLTRLRFDPSTRTLELYELAGKDSRWMLSTPSDPRGVPVDRVHQFPSMMDLDLERVAVFYVIGGRPSPAVTLQEILDAKDLRAGR